MRRMLLIAAAALVLAGCGSTRAAPPAYAHATAGTLRLSDGWVSADPMAGMSDAQMPGMAAPESVAYATLTNTGDRPDALVSVSTRQAASATLHATEKSAGGTSGTMVATASIPVPAHGHVTLAPGGFHIMLKQLTKRFAVGSQITMTWTFASGRSLTATFPVIDPADRP